jgi:hypothetical protein
MQQAIFNKYLITNSEFHVEVSAAALQAMNMMSEVSRLIMRLRVHL